MKRDWLTGAPFMDFERYDVDYEPTRANNAGAIYLTWAPSSIVSVDLRELGFHPRTLQGPRPVTGPAPQSPTPATLTTAAPTSSLGRPVPT